MRLATDDWRPTTASCPRRRLLLPLVGFLDIPPRFISCALGVVVGLQGLAIFVHGAFALAGDVENLAQLDVAPNFGPARLAVAIEALAIGVGCGLVVALQEKYFRDPIMRQGAVLVMSSALLNSSSAPARSPCCTIAWPRMMEARSLHFAGILQNPVVGIDRQYAAACRRSRA